MDDGVKAPTGEVPALSLRVFVSSTFGDMKLERDELARRVFRELRRDCANRQMELADIDLRWGVPREVSRRGSAAEACLEEIQRCNCFIGILGERYGSLAPAVPNGLSPWMATKLGAGSRSYTDWEISYALLRPELRGRRFFYLRGPEYVQRIPPWRRHRYRTQDRELQGKLKALRAAVREDANGAVPTFRDARQLGDRLLLDLRTWINQEHPEPERNDWLVRERHDQAAYARSRHFIYVPVSHWEERLEQHVAGSGPPLVLVGESGIGKTSLLANWSSGFAGRNPEALVIRHFVGSSQQSTDSRFMLQRCLGELQDELNLPRQVPNDPHALRLVFANLLYRLPSTRPVLLLFDGVDKLEPREGAEDLVWLPPQVPACVRVIVSTLPDSRSARVAEERCWALESLERPLSGPEDVKRLIGEFCARYGKKPPANLDELAACEQLRHPLFTVSLLEELRILGSEREVSSETRKYLEARDPASLFGLLLERWEKDYGGGRRCLVRRAMSAIWASRRGLTEDDLLTLLGSRGQRLPAAHWVRLHLASEHCLLNRNGLIGFSHELFRSAVEQRCVRGERRARQTRRWLASYHRRRPPDDRTIQELPWLLMQGEDWRGLARTLRDVSLLSRVWEASQMDAREYWATLEERARRRLPDAYESVLRSGAVDSAPESYWHLALLLRALAHREPAGRLLRALEAAYETSGDRSRRARMIGNQGILALDAGRLTEAARLHRREMELYASVSDLQGLQRSMNSLANVQVAQRNFREAFALHRSELRICRELAKSEDVATKNQALEDLATCLGGLGIVCQERKHWRCAERLHAEEERICRSLGDQIGLSRCLSNVARVRMEQGRLDLAEELTAQTLEIYRRLGDRDAGVRALGNVAIISFRLAHVGEALELARAQEAEARALGNAACEVNALQLQGEIYANLGNRLESVRFFGLAAEVCRRMGAGGRAEECEANRRAVLGVDDDPNRRVDRRPRE